MEIELKPCPFCGGKAKECVQMVASIYDPATVFVYCMGCGTRTRESSFPLFTIDFDTNLTVPNIEEIERMKLLWNRRVTDE